MIVAIFLVLLAINFNVAGANPHGTARNAKNNNNMAVLLQWTAVALAFVIGVIDLVRKLS